MFDSSDLISTVSTPVSSHPTARIAKAITTTFLIVEVKHVLEGLGVFIFVCDDAEVDFREILQSEEDFITKKARLTSSCVLVACFVSHRFTDPQSSIPESGKGRGE